jgi:UDP-N-acetylmuramyl tripeptide synthase
VDALYAATELNERAWERAEAAVAGHAPASTRDADVESLRSMIAAERNPDLVALRDAARARGVTFLHGEQLVSVGSGRGVRVWPEHAIPPVSEIDWDAVGDVPIALVTGSNGKTTVVRLLAAMAAATGRIAGASATDAVRVAGRTIDEGDYSGPHGARLLLRQPEVEVAILETARGGLLRRGLAVEHAAVAVVTNIADDHLGEFGVQSLEALAETKLLVARAIGDQGRLVLNADDAVLATAASRARVPLGWFSLHAANPRLEDGGAAATVDGETVLLREDGRTVPIASIAEIPLTMGGAARHNVANVLAALVAAGKIGVPPEAMADTLRRFGREPSDNPGRANLIELGGARILIDYAHNPDGMRALAAVTATIPARRRLVLLGQAGDRSDDSIRALATQAFALQPDRVVVKEMDRYLRGRRLGEVPGILAAEFRRLGVPPDEVIDGGPELAAVRRALGWARPGDLLVMALHQDWAQVMALLEDLRAKGWRAGDPVPGG